MTMTNHYLPGVRITKLRTLNRYTIEGKGQTSFRLVEDSKGAWIQWAELEKAIHEEETNENQPEDDQC